MGDIIGQLAVWSAGHSQHLVLSQLCLDGFPLVIVSAHAATLSACLMSVPNMCDPPADHLQHTLET